MYEFLSLTDWASAQATLTFCIVTMITVISVGVSMFMMEDRVVTENDWFWTYEHKSVFKVPAEFEKFWYQDDIRQSQLAIKDQNWALEERLLQSNESFMWAEYDGHKLETLEDYFFGHTMNELETLMTFVESIYQEEDELDNLWDRIDNSRFGLTA